MMDSFISDDSMRKLLSLPRFTEEEAEVQSNFLLTITG